MEAYSTVVERHMVEFYRSLSEKDRRRYAAVEAEKLGFGGMRYVASLFGCDEDTIRRGVENVAELPADVAFDRIRKKGGPQES
jgi:hypothetical protein